MKRFATPDEVGAVILQEDHGGVGHIIFRRLLESQDFQAHVDFIDFTIIPPQSIIGTHKHIQNEEAYLVVQGNPLVSIDDEENRLLPGSVAVVRSGQTHQLINDTQNDVSIFVVQVPITNHE